MTPSEFLCLLWGAAPPGQVLVWRLPSKHSTWFQHFQNVDAFCASHAGEEIYTGVSIVKHDARVTGATRTSNINAAGIAGLWADIDLAGPVHTKPGLPEDVNDMLEELESLPPGLIAHTGHGLQVWWLFEEPWLFADTAERIQAQRLTQWWHEQLAARFAARGWTIDATHDLARVMRLPGTFNNKAEPVPVIVIQEPTERLALAPLLEALPASSKKTLTTPTSSGHHLTLNPDAMPPLDKFNALMEVNLKFARSWSRSRTGLTDQSPSAYDMSLASIASQAGWTDQEIADLLIAHRRNHGSDLKLREDYYQRTINRARVPAETTEAVEALQQPDIDTPSALEVISQLLGIEIEEMYRFDTNPVTFGARIAGRDVRLGEADGINSQTKFRNKMAGATLKNINILSKASWEAVSQKLLSICETVDLGEETRPDMELQHLLLDYLAEHQAFPDMEAAVKAKRPFIVEEQTMINLPALMDYLIGALHRNFKRTDVTIWLRTLGATPKRIVVPNYGQVYVWALPALLTGTWQPRNLLRPPWTNPPGGSCLAS